jgi:putative Mg2+ transporter-C (MgtC) family protein
MSLELQFQAVFQIALAALLSMIIGLDRERRQRPAGLRTHMLVGIGACLFTILSIYAFPNESSSSRVASNIVVGIGFLGAGTIIKKKSSVHDLTTAATIWATAAVGMGVGAGAWFLALCTTLLIWVVLVVIRRLEPRRKPSSMPPSPSQEPPTSPQS